MDKKSYNEKLADAKNKGKPVPAKKTSEAAAKQKSRPFPKKRKPSKQEGC